MQPTNPSGGFVPVQDWQADIHEDHVGLKIRRRVDRRETVVGSICVVSAERKQRGKHVSGVAIVIDDQNPERQNCCRLGRRGVGGRPVRFRRDRQSYDELTSQTDAGAAHLHDAAVHFRERLHERQPDPEPGD